MSAPPPALLLRLALLAVGGLASGCFIPPSYDCRLLCDEQVDCPQTHRCVPYGRDQNVCEPIKGPICPAPILPDAGSAPDTGPPPDTGAPEDVTGPPPDKICYPGPDHCFTLSPALQQALVLWLDPGNLPARGAPISTWHDQSGRGNHARAFPPAVPRATGDGVEMVEIGARFEVDAQPPVVPGRDGFTIYVVGKVGPTPACFASGDNRIQSNRRWWALGWLPQTTVGLRPTVFLNDTQLVDSERADLGDLQPHLMVAARTDGELHLQVDQRVLPPVAIAADVDVNTGKPILLGNCFQETPPVHALQAVIIVAGELPATDRTALSTFLLEAFAIGR